MSLVHVTYFSLSQALIEEGFGCSSYPIVLTASSCIFQKDMKICMDKSRNKYLKQQFIITEKHIEKNN